jgi:hypothetical protein
MKKYIKILIFSFAFYLMQNAVFAITLDDITEPRQPFYRLGINDDLEKPYEVTNSPKTKTVKSTEPIIDIEKITYADLSIKKISNEIAQELDLEYNDMLADLSLLWQGAASKSDTVKFIVYKLSNPDDGKPNEKSVKKVLQTIASMSTLVGAGVGNPLLAGGAFIGGNILGIMSQDDKTLNYKYTKITDADMIILVRKIEDLQQDVVNAYYDYMTTRKLFDMTLKMNKQRQENYKLAQNSSREIILITDTFYRESLDLQMKSRSDFYSKRASLEQLVGNDIFKQFESGVNAREKTVNDD